jgi:hypothetical protein
MHHFANIVETEASSLHLYFLSAESETRGKEILAGSAKVPNLKALVQGADANGIRLERTLLPPSHVLREPAPTDVSNLIFAPENVRARETFVDRLVGRPSYTLLPLISTDNLGSTDTLVQCVLHTCGLYGSKVEPWFACRDSATASGARCQTSSSCMRGLSFLAAAARLLREFLRLPNCFRAVLSESTLAPLAPVHCCHWRC